MTMSSEAEFPPLSSTQESELNNNYTNLNVQSPWIRKKPT